MSEIKPSIYKYLMNAISIIGALIALVATIMLVVFILVDIFSGFKGPYLGFFVYFALPIVLITGLILIPVGAWRVRSNLRKHPELGIPNLPNIDFNNRRVLNLSIFFVSATVVFMLLIAFASFKGVEYTESSAFCGKLCHEVMQPEYTAWSNSSHANVKCVECHVGPGAEAYINAKISGLRQVLSVMTHSWPTPIPTPVHNLRPARNTCEHCHWPEKFYAGKYRTFYHFATNEENSKREINMNIKIGNAPKNPNESGIHWHVGREVTYIAGDEARMTIPYIAVKGRDGKITEYTDSTKPLSREAINSSAKRIMDCTDCHNRPAHVYHSPSEELDKHLTSKTIDSNLPYIKKISIEALEKPYISSEEAVKAIKIGLKDYYSKNYPEIAKNKEAVLNSAIEQVQEIYTRNYFPKMKVSWKSYPNHIGHLYTNGCFRCHDGKHKSAEGKLISKDCNICHEVVSQVQENIPKGKQVNQFVHPADIGNELYTTNCSDCHGIPSNMATGTHKNK